jgi:hypothetical protein
LPTCKKHTEPPPSPRVVTPARSHWALQ